METVRFSLPPTKFRKKRMLSGLKAALYICGIALLLALVWGVFRFVALAEHASATLDASVNQLQPKVARSLDLGNRVLMEASFAAKAGRQASQASIASVDKANKTLDLTQQTLTAVTSSLESVTRDTHTVALSAVATIDKTGYAVDAATTSIEKIGLAADSVQTLVSSPDIKMTFENMNKTTRELSGIAEDGHLVTTYYRKQLTHPAGFFKSLLKELIPLAAQSRILFSR